MEAPTIIITLDYEIWGDGSGDVRKLIIEPTDRLLRILNDKNIRMTVFFELEEFLVFKKYTKELRSHFGYDPVSLIEDQLKKIICEGHEIGLHLHPQWIGGEFNGKRFNLFMENQCLFDVYKNKQEITAYLKDRLTILRTLVKKYNREAEISCFRAGGFALRPEKLTINALYSLGIKADSSVIQGLYRICKSVNIDYRDAPNNKGFWRVNNDLGKPVIKGKIIEFPIYSQMKPEFKKLSINRIKQKFFSPNRTAKSISDGVSELALPKTPWGMLHHLFKKSPIKFDFCHMTSKEMLSFVYDAEKENGQMKYPLTMIGHSKEFFNDSHFAFFIDTVIKKRQFEFRTIGEIVNIIEEEKKHIKSNVSNKF